MQDRDETTTWGHTHTPSVNTGNIVTEAQQLFLCVHNSPFAWFTTWEEFAHNAPNVLLCYVFVADVRHAPQISASEVQLCDHDGAENKHAQI